MKKDTRMIPVPAARLIIKYLHNSLTKREQASLDNWINASPVNEDLFSELTDKVDDTVFDPNDLIIETEQSIDLWIIAGLIVREQKGLNDRVEQKYLRDWAGAGKQNKKLFSQLQHPAYMQKCWSGTG